MFNESTKEYRANVPMLLFSCLFLWKEVVEKYKTAAFVLSQIALYSFVNSLNIKNIIVALLVCSGADFMRQTPSR